MCGIAGIVSPDPQALRAIGPVTAALRHRGPDDEGYVLASSSARRASAFGGDETAAGLGLPRLDGADFGSVDVALGHRRLAILDLSPAGHGPMASEDGSLWITHNGEIYNFVEIRAELEGLGHRFRSTSDTEVILAAYSQWGQEALRRFNGMWAFGLLDLRKRVLFCARDRFGVKPLHFVRGEGFFAFASEIKGLLAHPLVPRRIREGALAGFLAGESTDATSTTFFEAVERLPAGHLLEVDLTSRRCIVESWYELSPRGPGNVADFGALLEDAVRLRLRSDVDVGSCLSGGLDSSTIVSIVARQRARSDFGRHAFSVAYQHSGIDESPYIDAVVAATGVTAHRSTPTAEDLATDLEHVAAAQDEPFPGAGVFSQWCVMHLARDAGVKVLLDGQGADEILGGYHYQYGPLFAETLARHGLGAAISAVRDAHRATGRPLSFFLGQLLYHATPLPAGIRRAMFERAATNRPVPPSLLEGAFDNLAPKEADRMAPVRTFTDARLRSVVRTSLPALLRYEDRNSMAFGIETRTPFLDYRLVELALGLPCDALVHDGRTKWALRETARPWLPRTVVERRDKLGFATPETAWLRELAPRVREWLGPLSRIASRLNPAALRRLLALSDEELARQNGLFRLISAELWLSRAGSSNSTCAP